MDPTQFSLNSTLQTQSTSSPTNFVFLQPINSQLTNVTPNLLSSTSWSSSSSSGYDECRLDTLTCDNDTDSFEIVPYDGFDPGCQTMMVEVASSSSVLSPPQNNGSSLLTTGPFSNGFGTPPDPNLHLWQFLLECLEDKRFANVIRWTSDISPPASPTPRTNGRRANNDHSSEFCIIEPRELARSWAVRRYGHVALNEPFVDAAHYQRFNRVLRYYHNKKRLLHKLVGKPNTYVFLIDIQPHLSAIRANTHSQDRMLLT